MAKKQSFVDKTKKAGASDFKTAKVIFSVRSEKTNAWRFIEKNVRIPNGENDQEVISKAIAGFSK
jgi:hypothetical protein|uniref:DUF4295 domain-containing protein n=1 Tax=Chlorobium chlorochromatii (strain CaD3) TaxID=340177 RepID=Q3AS63_CHLCH